MKKKEEMGKMGVYDTIIVYMTCPKCGKGTEDNEYAVANDYYETVVCPNCNKTVPYMDLRNPLKEKQ